jgi:heat shock protein HtpX
MEAVLGHELTHIRNGDVRMMVVAVIIAGAIGFFAELLFRLWFNTGITFGGGRSRSDEDRGKGGNMFAILIAVALIAIAWLLSVVIRLALSREREYLADAGSVELTKNPDAMISALRKIEGRGELQGATSAVMELCVDNPREGFSDVFDTHPTVEKRIAALIKFAGGHDPGPIALEPTAQPGELPPAGPWSAAPGAGEPQMPPGLPPQAGQPFLPNDPPVRLGGDTPPLPPIPPGKDGPWGPHN